MSGAAPLPDDDGAPEAAPSEAVAPRAAASFSPSAAAQEAARRGVGTSVIDDVVKLGLPELPVLGPFALLTAGAALAPLALLATAGTHSGPEPLSENAQAAAVVAAGALCFHLFAAVGLTLGYARLDARARGDDTGAPALLRAALARVPRMLAILALFSLACVSFTVVPLLPAMIIGATDDIGVGPVVAVLATLSLPFAWLVLVALSARLMISAPLVAVDGAGVFAALREAWRATRGHTWAVTWRTAVGIFVSLFAVGMASGVIGIFGPVGGALALLVSCGVILPLDAVFIYGIYRRLRTDAGL